MMRPCSALLLWSIYNMYYIVLIFARSDVVMRRERREIYGRTADLGPTLTWMDGRCDSAQRAPEESQLKGYIKR